MKKTFSYLLLGASLIAFTLSTVEGMNEALKDTGPMTLLNNSQEHPRSTQGVEVLSQMGWQRS